MAKEEHLAVLWLGAEAWNRWREEHKESEIDLSNANLEKADLKGFNLSRVNLDGAHLSGVNLERANLSSASLKRVNLSHANLDHASLAHARLRTANLALAHLENTALFFADMRKADFRGAFLKNASVEDADLRGANFAHAHLKGAQLAYSNCSGADFVDANLSGVNLIATSLEKANVSSVKYDTAIFRSVLKETGFHPKKLWRRRLDILLNTTVRCKGVHAACYGSQRFQGFLKGQDFLEELMETRRGMAICVMWWLLADCGRSIVRWAFWSFLFIFLFGLAYFSLGADSFRLATLPFGLGSMMYFSVVTFSTLGFGDVIPKSPAALVLAATEVFLGYLMMGGLISIFATKLARAAR